MDGSGFDDEISTVGSYTWARNGAPGQSPIAGGPARLMVPPNDRFKLVSDDPIAGVATNFTVGVAFRPVSVGGNQIVLANLDHAGVPTYMVRIEGTDLKVWVGNGTSSAASVTALSGVTNGSTYVVSFSYDPGTQDGRIIVNGGATLVHNFPAAPLTGAQDFFGGGWDSGQPFAGEIAAPTVWNVVLSDALQLAWQNGGAPWRL